MPEGFIFGSGAQGRVALDVLKLQFPETNWFFIDENPSLWNQKVNGSLIVGGLDALKDKRECKLHIALGKPSAKEKVTKTCEAMNIELINAVHPSAIILPSAVIGQGVFIGAGAVINTDAKIGKGAVINTRAVVEHDTIVGDFANISPTACLGGRVTIGKGSFIGSGAIVLARTVIGGNSVVGMGAVVTRDIPENKMAYGVPARIVKNIDETTDWSKIL